VSAVKDRHLAIKAREKRPRCERHHLQHEPTWRLLPDNAVMESFFSTVKSELADRFDGFGDGQHGVV
jgi:hypothetical protein